MHVSEWLGQTVRLLETAGIATARLDSLVLLEDCLGLDRASLLAHPETEISDRQSAELQEQVKRRAGHEPLAYIRGEAEFYGRPFTVDQRVLVPRPESEMMIDVLKQLESITQGGRRAAIADIGCGSGCLGITAALELGLEEAAFYDISPAALDAARANAKRYKLRGRYVRADLLAHGGPHDIILANLPYVPDGFTINQAAGHEPSLALFGGPDGLDLYRRLFRQLRAADWRPRLVLTESLPEQHDMLAEVARPYGYRCIRDDDFIQAFVPDQ